MKLRLWAASVAALAFTGYTNNNMVPSFSPSAPTAAPQAPAVQRMNYDQAFPEKQERFREDMIAVATSTKNDPNYHRMALDTPERKAWFKNLMYQFGTDRSQNSNS